MAIATGGGQYEKQTEALLRSTEAEVCIVLIAHRMPGKSGFSVAMTRTGVASMPAIIDAMRHAAAQMEDHLTSNEQFPDPSTTQGQDATNESDSNKEG